MQDKQQPDPVYRSRSQRDRGDQFQRPDDGMPVRGSKWNAASSLDYLGGPEGAEAGGTD